MCTYTGAITVVSHSVLYMDKLSQLEFRNVHLVHVERDALEKRCQKFYSTNFKKEDRVYLRFEPDSDFDSSEAADGGLYVALVYSSKAFDFGDHVIPPDRSNQLNRINHTYSFTAESDDFYFAVTYINGPADFRPTQDRVHMLIGTDPGLESAFSFAIRYDLDE